VNHPASGAGGLCIGMAAAPHDSVSQHSASVNYSIGSAQAVGWRRRRQTSRQVSVAGLPVTTCLPGRHERSCSVLSGEWLLSLFSQESWSQSVRARDNKHSDPPTPSNPSSQVIAQATEPACNAALHFTASLMFAPAGVDASKIQAAIDELNAYVPLSERCLHPVPTFDTDFSGSATIHNGVNEMLFGPRKWDQTDYAGLTSRYVADDGSIIEADIDINSTLPAEIYDSEEYICVVAHEFAHAMGYQHGDKIYHGRSSGGLSLGLCAEAKLNARDHAYCDATFEPDSYERFSCHLAAQEAAADRHLTN